jgi:hypothetical protein
MAQAGTMNKKQNLNNVVRGKNTMDETVRSMIWTSGDTFGEKNGCPRKRAVAP